jgi:hypothetical protein
VAYRYSRRGSVVHLPRLDFQNPGIYGAYYRCGAWMPPDFVEADEPPFGYGVCRLCEESGLFPGMHVYFFERADGLVKIGFSRDVTARVRTLGPGRLIAATPGGRDLECQLHARFANSRQTGEWFVLTPELAAYIDGLASPAVAS